MAHFLGFQEWPMIICLSLASFLLIFSMVRLKLMSNHSHVCRCWMGFLTWSAYPLACPKWSFCTLNPCSSMSGTLELYGAGKRWWCEGSFNDAWGWRGGWGGSRRWLGCHTCIIYFMYCKKNADTRGTHNKIPANLRVWVTTNAAISAGMRVCYVRRCGCR